MSITSGSGPVAAEELSFGNEKQGLEAPVLTKGDDDYAVGITADGEVPTEEELKTLRRVSDKIPFNIYTIAFIELCERFSYYGTTAVFTNFIQWPLPPGSTTGANFGQGQAGALGLGQQTSTALTTFNAFWQYSMPLFGAYIADSYLGRFNTIALALGIDILGHVVLITSALPPVIKNPDGAMAAFILGIITMGLGTGGFKPNVNPLIVEQLDLDHMIVKTLPDGERVIVDPHLTASRVYHYFYLFINIGALVGQISMVYCEYYVGFWLSYTLPTIMLCFCPLVMLWGRKRYRRVPPEGSILGKAFKLLGLACKGRISINPVRTFKNIRSDNFWEAVKPSKLGANKPKWMDFNDAWVDEIARGFSACAVFLWYPLYWICYNQINNNLISQAAVMRLGGIPNDVLTNLNPFSLIILIPIMDTIIYPGLRKIGIHLTPLKRITAGYFVAGCSMIWACVVQYYIYQRSDCGKYASGYLDAEKTVRCPNVDISVWAQTGSYVLLALSEVLASITSLEYAHSKAPKSARSMVQAVCLFMNAIASAIGFGLVPLAKDPLLVWNFAVPAFLAFIGGTMFWLQFRKLDQAEDRLNMLPPATVAAEAEDAKEVKSHA
ncbi:POT family-domain-containing protein [Podospora aff. communis PSN243]|uniref:POT family-domain-containing protein n=1 Tax=Podospora aff. communis PSN243 TaxID=3040156 RepID=A0AAV9H276_9PEZI|nr:POT family-domain-containing protein [Podospora aff. communis PSN243]